jgi:hypothetical protein
VDYRTSIIGIMGIADNIDVYGANNWVFIGFGPICDLKGRKFIFNPPLTICITRDRVYCRMKNENTKTDVRSSACFRTFRRAARCR